MQIAWNEQATLELVVKLQFSPHIDHCVASVRCNTVMHVGSFLERARRRVRSHWAAVLAFILDIANIFRAVMKGSRGRTDGDIANSGILDVTAFVHSKVDAGNFLYKLVGEKFDCGEY